MTAAKKNSLKYVKTILADLGFVAIAAFLFAASFPNPVFEHGLSFIAWIALVPFLLVIQKNSIVSCAGWGAVYGLFAYGLFNYWLAAFHPLAGTIVYSIYIVYLAVVFVLLKLAEIIYPKKAYLVQWVIWIAFEYLRTLGFLGYSYGIIGYSQWRVIPLIQIAEAAGVWGISAIVTFPSFWLASAFRNFSSEKNFGKIIASCGTAVKEFFRKEKISAIVWTTALASSLVFGFVSLQDFSSFPKADIALIQHNTDPWEASKAKSSQQITDSYRKDLVTLKRLSDSALASDPKPQLVVWSETAFVPRIYWHTTFRKNQDIWLLTKDLLDYLAAKDTPFLIGNDDARMEPQKNPDPSEDHRVDYNAALFFEKGQITDVYRKIHLVPFTEHFPYQKRFPFVFNWLKNADTHFWEKGDEKTVFRLAESSSSFSFSAPICFEDTFGYLSRDFVRLGADVLVNISNDAWSRSLPAQNQHLSMAVFRAVENRRSMVRSTASGQTCAIDPNGRITAMAEPFTEAFLNVSVPIVKKQTMYIHFGDTIALIFVFTTVFLLLLGAVWYKIKGGKKL